MQNENEFSKMLEEVRTKEELNIFLEKLEEFKASQYKVKGKSVDAVTLVGREQWLGQLEERARQMGVVSLKLAIVPKKEMLEAIWRWLRENVSKGLVIDVEVDPELVAGAQVVFNGKFVDESLKKELEKIKPTV